ncbi:FG-GAP-like repeat-containing protein [Solirubrobacter phytolaccae]|uniref:FG-GAP-like repeat-containing protein n=1 Tax=Solirubrobacter phytolaccae TaxID=1404360 RepID=A0A9X3NAZ9_9ACTN|nr:FG-GAP-like repeat-containing protein [Solirubrobacter phytolaccae]MDA0180686.1 FG-GAP-like repeat-containing protein [Solirubrobacter phytolaccae]
MLAPAAFAGTLATGGPVDLLTEANLRVDGLAANAKLGDKIASAGDFNGDGINDVALAVWMVNGDSPTRTQGGAVYVVYGKASPTNVNLGALGANGVRIEGALAGDHLGWSLAPAGDVNNDGKGDLLLGTPWSDPSSRISAGGAHVVYGRASTTEIDLASNTAGFRIDGAAAGDRTGYSVATGDVNGDGRRDYILGAIGAQPGAKKDAGAAYVVYGKADQANTDLGGSYDGFRLDGESAGARTGWSVAAGDFDGDGKSDVAVGAIGAKDAAGSTFVVKGGTTGIAYRFDGDADDQSGWSLAAGDVDGDKKAELVIGVPFHNPASGLMAGSAYVLKPAASHTLAALPAGSYRIDGAKSQDGAGWAVATSGDLNGDGLGEIILGAPGADRPAIPQESIGAAYAVYGSKTPANVALATLGTKGATINGGGSFKWGDQAGWSVAGLGDITGTGVNVVAVGVPGLDTGPTTANRDRGAGLLLNGVVDPNAPTITISTPLDGAKIPVGTPATVAFSCDDDNTLVSCFASDSGRPILNGEALTTGPDAIGPHTIVVTAKDAAGNTTTKSVTYNVVVVATTPVGGTVPAVLSLSLGAPATFPTFVPGVAREYSAITKATVLTTAGDATLSYSDPGHLTNGAFSLAEPLRIELAKSVWTGPASNEDVNITFKQLIKATDPLRTGTYSKTVTFTLATNNP